MRWIFNEFQLDFLHHNRILLNIMASKVYDKASEDTQGEVEETKKTPKRHQSGQYVVATSKPKKKVAELC